MFCFSSLSPRGGNFSFFFRFHEFFPLRNHAVLTTPPAPYLQCSLSRAPLAFSPVVPTATSRFPAFFYSLCRRSRAEALPRVSTLSFIVLSPSRLHGGGPVLFGTPSGRHLQTTAFSPARKAARLAVFTLVKRAMRLFLTSVRSSLTRD